MPPSLRFWHFHACHDLISVLLHGSDCEVLWRVWLCVCVTVCLCVCLPVCEDISGATRAIFTKYFVYVAYGRGVVLLESIARYNNGTLSLSIHLYMNVCLYNDKIFDKLDAWQISRCPARQAVGICFDYRRHLANKTKHGNLVPFSAPNLFSGFCGGIYRKSA